jgi:hypothetical protein
MKSKKGQISINVLVIGVFIVCLVALGSFVFAGYKFSKTFVGYNTMEEVYASREQFRTYQNLMPEAGCQEISSLMNDIECFSDEDSVEKVRIIRKFSRSDRIIIDIVHEFNFKR